ncbi:NAD(P)/FAD-dependent oxidoreductase [Paralysiella testudinis]|uniref:NAD(P)/FAD-dependent oxidoreductase n=1 Tax=Paralysiella testudinis TaxID=2809020 RepID=A0A892ZDR3_9NEIS|nr:NAD(P)/FAD-dependent oxidoreductase [Paralysiella testudinis]QRQ81495.1 NAD(P)/FAD-dependent oxidoreductase [Paralysiella testudinis]
MTDYFDVAIIGAGPAGAVAAALLNQRGFKVCVLEKQHFPRFVVGESLLPHCMEILAEAGLLAPVQAAGFQHKDGIVFSRGDGSVAYDFTDKFHPGPGTALNVQRDRFDKMLIDQVIDAGATVRFGESVVAFGNDDAHASLRVVCENGEYYQINAGFVFDASGHFRAIPRLRGWEMPTHLPVRQVHLTHIDDHITDSSFDRNKNMIITHPQYADVWLWLTPFSNGRISVGVVGRPERFTGISASADILKKFVRDVPMLADLLANAVWDNGFPFLYLSGFAANVKYSHGQHFALLGNAAGFLDPAFSSGTTIAMHSAKLAADVLTRQLQGETVDWQTDFADALNLGVNTLHTYAEGWYEGRFQDLIYGQRQSPEEKRMLSAILAGYAWDKKNPYVRNAQAIMM